MTIKINRFEVENVKRIKAVKVEPTANGMTVIGGKNNQGKTSVIDSIAWALGGDRYRPSKAQRDGSVTPPNLKVILSNGLIVERKGKNSTLKITDPNGNKSGQQVLNSFVEELAINLPKFMNSNSQEKAKILLQIIGVGDELFDLESKEKAAYDERHAIGQIKDRKKKYAEEMEYYPDAPKELVSASDLIKQQQDILAQNGENARKREKVNKYQWEVDKLTAEVQALEQKLKETNLQMQEALDNLSIARTDALDLVDQSTQELEDNISSIEKINIKVRANLDKEKAEEDARDYERQYDELTDKIEVLRKQKFELLKNADLPLPELSVENGEIMFKGQKWDNMSGSEQLKVSASIVRKLNPECGFVLMDKMEQMDIDTLNEFNDWLEKEGLQVICTRVSTGDECSIIIEDGYVKGEEHVIPPQPQPKPMWEAGKF